MKNIVKILLLLLLTACEKKSTPTHFRGTAMTIDYHIIIGKSLKSCQKRHAEKIIHTTFEEVDQDLQQVESKL